jgi:hypothetical protein
LSHWGSDWNGEELLIDVTNGVEVLMLPEIVPDTEIIEVDTAPASTLSRGNGKYSIRAKVDDDISASIKYLPDHLRVVRVECGSWSGCVIRSSEDPEWCSAQSIFIDECHIQWGPTGIDMLPPARPNVWKVTGIQKAANDGAQQLVRIAPRIASSSPLS